MPDDRIVFRMNPSDIEKLKDIAWQKRVSLSNLCRYALNQYINQGDAPKPKSTPQIPLRHQTNPQSLRDYELRLQDAHRALADATKAAEAAERVRQAAEEAKQQAQQDLALIWERENAR